jgi:hypothetical protein
VFYAAFIAEGADELDYVLDRLIFVPCRDNEPVFISVIANNQLIEQVVHGLASFTMHRDQRDFANDPSLHKVLQGPQVADRAMEDDLGNGYGGVTCVIHGVASFPVF